jgi:hypothetical protein
MGTVQTVCNVCLLIAEPTQTPCPIAVLPHDSDMEYLGPEFVDSHGNVELDLYSVGCINEWSWKYTPEQDPFGSMLSEL